MSDNIATEPRVYDVQKRSLYLLEDIPYPTRSDFDYVKEPGLQFFTYKGAWYDLGEFCSLQYPDLSPFMGNYNVPDWGEVEIEWHASYNLTYFSSVVVNTDPICFEDAVWVGCWTS